VAYLLQNGCCAVLEVEHRNEGNDADSLLAARGAALLENATLLFFRCALSEVFFREIACQTNAS
jgi:hypothetical protein